MTETKEVFAVMGNTDNTEGRGKAYVIAYAKTRATALRLGAGKYIQGSNCPIHTATLHKPTGTRLWLGPVDLEGPTPNDMATQIKLDAHEKLRDRARASGLTDEDIRNLEAWSLK